MEELDYSNCTIWEYIAYDDILLEDFVNEHPKQKDKMEPLYNEGYLMKWLSDYEEKYLLNIK